MASLNDDHIGYIVKDLNYRGLVHDGLQEEVADHICSMVERKMDEGLSFYEAYHESLRAFGHTRGLRQTQRQTLLIENKTTRLMLQNYFKIALRNLSKHRFYSIINVLGLSTGIASCLLIVLFVLNETSYDRYHQKADRIYRLSGEIKYGGNHYQLAVAPAPMADALWSDYPEVESAVRFRARGSYLVKREGGTESIKEHGVIWTDSTFFDVFTVPVLKGNDKNALTDPNTVAISESMANKYFPGDEALGQTLIMDNRWPMKVTAIFADMPQNGHFRFDFLLALAGLDEAQNHNFLSNNFNTYLLLREGASAADLEKKLPQFVQKYMGPQAKEALGVAFDLEQFVAAGNKLEYTLMPLTDIHLHSDLTAELGANGDITYVYLFSAIALFILLIACINFMNLSTARSANRAKEVGVRKVMGSLRAHLVRQFLTESMLVTLVSFAIAVGLAYIALPYFNLLAAKELYLPVESLWFYGWLAVAALLVGLLAGLYPSFFLSAFEPVKVLKGQLSLGMKSGLVRSSLVVFQFAITIFLIIGTVVIQRQLTFIQEKKIGFKKDQVLMVEDAYALGDQQESFKKEMMQNASVLHGTISGYVPVDIGWRSDNTWWPAGTQPTEENMVGLQTWNVDYDYVKTMGMEIIDGRDFSDAFPSDSSAVILNEAAVKLFGFEKEPLGQKISTFSDNNEDGSVNRQSETSSTVIGVVKDFHFQSLRNSIGPVGLYLGSSPGYVSFRFQAGNTTEVINQAEQIWKRLAPGQPFQYTFLDEAFGNMYSTEQKLGKILGVFATLAILIACLGLFALTAFTAEQRTKEIGIRKVLGASVGSIVMLLSREFGKLILIAFVIAAPASWYAVRWWLEGFTYKTQVGVVVYLLAGVACFIVAWLTMGYQSLKAATANPVDSLKSE